MVALVAWIAAGAAVCQAPPPTNPAPPAPTAPETPPPAPRRSTPPPAETPAPSAPTGATAPAVPPPTTTPAPETPATAAPTGATAPGSVEQPAAPTEPKLGENQYRIDADELRYTQGAVFGRGHVRIHYKDLILSCDAAEIDENQEWSDLHGNVVITSPSERTTAEQLRFNLETGEWKLTGGWTELEPSFFAEGLVHEPVYLGGEAVTSTPRLNLVESHKSELTTCDLPDPHYDVTADSTAIRPGRDITFDHPTFYLLGRRIFRYPGKIRVSLRDKHGKIVPEFGENDVEGFYAKFAYPYDAGPHANGLIHLNLTTKRGPGVGVDHYFHTGQSAGEFSFFYEPFMSSYSALVQHMYQFNRGLSSSLNLSLQTNSGYGLGASTSMASDWTIRADSANAHTTLGFEDSLSDGSGFSSQSFISNFLHQQTGPAGLNWTIRSMYQSSDFGAGESSQNQLQLYLDLLRHQPAFDAELTYQQTLNLGNPSPTNFLYATDELPALVLSSDTKRLGIPWFAIPINTRLEIGQFHEEPDDITVTRTSAEADMYGQPIHLAKGHDVLSGMSFRQTFYSDGSAQYDIRADSNFQSHWGGPWYSQVSWNWELPQGNAPLRNDFAAKQNYVSVDLSRYIANRSRIEFTSGYDAEAQTWQDALLRGEYTPNMHNRFELQADFDPNFHQWRPFQFQWQYAQLNRLNLTLVTSYDTQLSTLAQVALDSDWVLSRKWRLETLTSYNGALHDFDYLEARITRDLHCWLGSLSYSLSNREIRINFALKAFPFEDWQYGIGNRGQLLTPTFSQYY